ncbi:ARM repeat-containing protein [Glarea lozoyensis ATCC 20868]|uniref:ARM repeat-containing protein n=1 Tax=Glarea lozoyensis (strain ATCC 20868 / MF5171) TaxID=1116229 RepID=S3D9R0_GLAL2|nr:ARM repeat-containing protein [Glarea lozoyensis ATCC 20868]EPE28716.1 ARM repeat-containing protein [Glarea lozoyensis ATCC 20868]
MALASDEQRDGDFQRADEPPSDDRLLVKWLEGQSESSQTACAERKVQELLENASQPRHASGNACIKLCYFIEQCRGSSCSPIRDVVFSKSIALRLFYFYIEWSEKNQNRSMRQVLELLSSLIARNPNSEVSGAIKSSILLKTLSVITHDSIQPAVKPSFKVLECFLGKTSISPNEICVGWNAYTAQKQKDGFRSTKVMTATAWDSLVSSVFYWLGPADVSPAAGKFLVTLFKTLRGEPGQGTPENHSSLWQRWIREGIAKNPDSLENVKNYLFTPLFKLDRAGSLAFLQDLNQQSSVSMMGSQDIDAHAMLQLAAMDAGKKSGLIEEPSNITFSQKKSKSKNGETILLDEQAIGALLANPSDTVRSLALSVLITSFSSTRPFSPSVLEMLKSHIGFFHSDTDAKFRNEVVSNTKHLIERLRGTTALLVRELEQVSFKIAQSSGSNTTGEADDQKLHDSIESFVAKHQQFIEWYADFLLSELVPTASYQRHITALRALQLLLTSKLQGEAAWRTAAPVPANSTVWPFEMEFFNSRSIRLLLDLLMDPFDDVRTLAMDILTLCPPNKFSTESYLSLNANENERQNIREDRDNTTGNCSKAMGEHSLANLVDQESLDLLTDFITKANLASMNSGRADYADGVARAFKLLHNFQSSLANGMAMIDRLVKDLERKVEIAEQDLAKAVLDAPVHGNFAALSYICEYITSSLDPTAEDQLVYWTKWSNLQQRMVLLASRIWAAVQEVLCNDSPEGHLPQELDEMDAVDTKNILSYSFRAVHESSNLMRILAESHRQIWIPGFSAHVTSTFTQIGNLSFTQLSTLRHRGAFSTVALTFSRCCQLTQNSRLKALFLDSPDTDKSSAATSVSDLLQQWWEGALKCIATQASTTRRSAGIPVLVTGIMSAMSQTPSIDNMIPTLISRARVPVSSETNSTSNLRELPQVHALNSIRQAFKTSSVRNQLDSSVNSCLELAADCFGSDVWPIKNCGLLLFQTLTDFLLGTETKEEIESGWGGQGTKVAFDRYPKVWSVLTSLLESSSTTDEESATLASTVERTIPVLDILRRAGSPEKDLPFVYENVLRHLDSKSWHVRELAARTLCALSPSYRWKDVIAELKERTGESANRSHGTWLVIGHIIARQIGFHQSDSDSLDDLWDIFQEYFSIDISVHDSLQVTAAYLEAGNIIMRVVLSNTGFTVSEPEEVYGSAKKVNNSNEEQLSTAKLLDTFTAEQCTKALSAVKSWPSTNDLSFQALVRRTIYLSAVNHRLEDLADVLLYAVSKSSSAALVAIETMQNIFGTQQRKDDRLFLFYLYSEVVNSSTSPSVRAIALNHLTGLLDLFTGGELGALGENILELSQGSHWVLKSPELSIAWVKFSGSQAYVVSLQACGSDEDLRKWGLAIVDCLTDEKSYEMREAATSALMSFYSRPRSIALHGHDCLLPSLFALYNALNDDEEEIRMLAASVVAAITEKALVPPAAADELVNWLTAHFNDSNLFGRIVANRIIGSANLGLGDESNTSSVEVRAQIEKSFAQDTELFAVESQNLWIDHHGETLRWAQVLGKLRIDVLKQRNSSLKKIVSYAVKGLETLNTTLKTRHDGAFGWSSKPEAFTSCTRVICCVNITLTHLNSLGPSLDEAIAAHVLRSDLEEMKILLDTFLYEAHRNSFNDQLLMLLVRNDTLEKKQLQELLPERVSLIVNASPYLGGQRVRRK